MHSKAFESVSKSLLRRSQIVGGTPSKAKKCARVCLMRFDIALWVSQTCAVAPRNLAHFVEGHLERRNRPPRHNTETRTDKHLRTRSKRSVYQLVCTQNANRLPTISTSVENHRAPLLRPSPAHSCHCRCAHKISKLPVRSKGSVYQLACTQNLKHLPSRSRQPVYQLVCTQNLRHLASRSISSVYQLACTQNLRHLPSRSNWSVYQLVCTQNLKHLRTPTTRSAYQLVCARTLDRLPSRGSSAWNRRAPHTESDRAATSKQKVCLSAGLYTESETSANSKHKVCLSTGLRQEFGLSA